MSEDVVAEQEDGVYTDSEWVRRWQEGEAYWHSVDVNPWVA